MKTRKLRLVEKGPWSGLVVIREGNYSFEFTPGVIVEIAEEHWPFAKAILGEHLTAGRIEQVHEEEAA